MVANQATVQARAAQFDGAAVLIPSCYTRIMAPANVSEATILSELSGWAAADFGTLTHNFAIVIWCGTDYGPGGGALAAIDWTNDTHWATIAANFGHLAAALKSVGKFDGIFFDNEAYCVTWALDGSDYPWNWGGNDNQPGDTAANGQGILPAHSRQAAYDLVYGRAGQIMDAVLDAWPECQFMQTHSAFAADYYAGEAFAALQGWNNLWWTSELKGPFYYGTVARTVARNQGRVWDGGEMYGIRSLHDHYEAARFRLYEAPRVANQFFYQDPLSDHRVLASQAIYDRDEFDGYALHPAATLQTLLIDAMRGNQSYVWFYSEEHDWWGACSTDSSAPAAPQEYLDAMAAGKLIGRGGGSTTGGGGDPTTFGRTAIGGGYDLAFADYRVGSLHATTGVWSVTKLSAYVSGTGSGTGAQVAKGLIYAGTAGSAVLGALLGTTVEVSVADGQAAGWVDFTFSTPVALSTGSYWLMLHLGATHDTIRFSWDTAISNGAGYTPDTYAGGAATPGGTLTLQAGQYALYATGTSEPLDDLIFDSDRTGNYELYRLSAAGVVTQLTSNATYDSWWPRLNPAGTKIVFCRSPAGVHDGDVTQIHTWTCDPDGSGLVNILPLGVDSWDVQGHPHWSPSGAKIVTMGGAVDLYTCDPDGSGRALLTTTGQNFGLADPAYSPDGTTIIYSYQPTGTDLQNIYTVPAAGGTPTAITTDGALTKKYYDPVFSPDGTKIAALVHTGTNPSTFWNIYVMNANGSSPSALIADGNINSRPEWAPNGSHIYFHRNPPGSGGAGPFGLWTITYPGAVLTAIASGATGSSEYPALS